MRPRTRKMLCRVLFVGFCVLPTLAVACWCVAHHLPARKAAVEHELERLLACDVSLGGIEYPRPGVTVYSQVVLRDAEFGRPLAAADRVEVRQSREGISLDCSPVETSHSLNNVWQFVESQLRRVRHTRVLLTADSLACSGTEIGLSNVRLDLLPGHDVSEARIGCRAADAESQTNILLRIVRDRRQSPPVTRWHLNPGTASAEAVAWALHLKTSTTDGPEIRQADARRQ